MAYKVFETDDGKKQVFVKTIIMHDSGSSINMVSPNFMRCTNGKASLSDKKFTVSTVQGKEQGQ